MVEPENPEARFPESGVDRRGKERPDTQSGPEIQDSLQESTVPQDCEGSEEGGEVTEVKGEALRTIKAGGKRPVGSVEDSSRKRTPANQVAKESST